MTHDFEDTRGSGATLEDAAAKHKLPVTKVTIDTRGNDQTGKPVEDLPGGDFLPRAFATEPGIDGELTEGAEGAYYDFRVDKIAAATKKPLEEVREQILADWRAAELEKRLKAIADDPGGGLTFIANAPNPAGVAILKSSFDDESISPMGLFLAALPPTCVAIFAFQVL